MAIALIANDSAPSAGGTLTTASLDTTGANLLVAFYVSYASASITTFSDSKTNTWTALTSRTGATNTVQIHYVTNPTVGAGHTLTVAGTSSFHSASFYAFSGADTSAPFDQQNGAFNNNASSLQPGSVTPTTDGQLIFTGVSIETGATYTIGSGFTIPANATEVFNSGVSYGLSTAYLIQTTAAAINPTWTPSTGPIGIVTAIATFKAAGGGGTTPLTFTGTDSLAGGELL